LTQTPYAKLTAMLDAFIDEFGGKMRIRGVLTAMLILRTSLQGRGISISEVSQVSGAPLESIRRHFAANVEEGFLITQADPDDERVTRYLAASLEFERDRGRRIATTLHGIGSPFSDQPASDASAPHEQPLPFTVATCDALIEVLKTFMAFLDGGMRMRAFKIAIVMQEASLSREGITASQIARVSGAPLETVRRTLQKYLDMGNLEVIEDPNDERASLMRYRDPVGADAAIRKVADRLEEVEWALFNLA
jgi:DNA-binding transcriptional ArsR family regulator